LRCREAGFRVRVEHPADEVLGAGGDPGPWLPAEVDAAAEDGLRDLLVVVAPEWRHAAEEDVEDDAGAPHVHLLAVAPLEHLGGHVVGAPHHLREPVAGAEEDGQAEVDDLERRVLRLVGEQEVLRLQVPVDHPVRVAQLRVCVVRSVTCG
jgi:hypothetical protein